MSRILKVLTDVRAVVEAGSIRIEVGRETWLTEFTWNDLVGKQCAAGLDKTLASRWQDCLDARASTPKNGTKIIQLTTPESPLRMSGGAAHVLNDGRKRWLVLFQRSRFKEDGVTPNPRRPLVLDGAGGIHDERYAHWEGVMGGETAELGMKDDLDDSAELLVPRCAELPQAFNKALMAELLAQAIGADVYFIRIRVGPVNLIRPKNPVEILGFPTVMIIEPENFSLEPRVILQVPIRRIGDVTLFDLEGTFNAVDDFKPLRRTVFAFDCQTGKGIRYPWQGEPELTSVETVVKEIKLVPADQRDRRVATEKVVACIKAMPFECPGLAPLAAP